MKNYSNFVIPCDNVEFFNRKDKKFVIIYNDCEKLKVDLTNYRFSFYLFNYKNRNGKSSNAVIVYCGDGFKRNENDIIKYANTLKYHFEEVKKTVFNTNMDNFVKKYFGNDVESYSIKYNCNLEFHRVGTTVEMRKFDSLIEELAK